MQVLDLRRVDRQPRRLWACPPPHTPRSKPTSWQSCVRAIRSIHSGLSRVGHRDPRPSARSAIRRWGKIHLGSQSPHHVRTTSRRSRSVTHSIALRTIRQTREMTQEAPVKSSTRFRCRLRKADGGGTSCKIASRLFNQRRSSRSPIGRALDSHDRCELWNR